MKYWWVNQKQTFRHEFAGNFLWSPKKAKNGSRNQGYLNMLELEVGDIVFSYANGFIKAISIVRARAVSSTKPDFGYVNNNWDEEGWLIEVSYKAISNNFKPRNNWNDLSELFDYKYAPLNRYGDGNQGIYLASIPELTAEKLIEMIGDEFYSALGDLLAIISKEQKDSKALAEIKNDSSIKEVERVQLVKARIGQGKYRINVCRIEKSCRLTGLSITSHLVASHIKPWRFSNNYEKLDGNNGLMLSPHIDHLFDNGFITFDDDGTIKFSKSLNKEVIRAWSIHEDVVFGEFNQIQKTYLRFHRDNVFIK